MMNSWPMHWRSFYNEPYHAAFVFREASFKRRQSLLYKISRSGPLARPEQQYRLAVIVDPRASRASRHLAIARHVQRLRTDLWRSKNYTAS